MSKTKKIVLGILAAIVLIALIIAAIFLKNNFSSIKRSYQFSKLTLEEEYSWQSSCFHTYSAKYTPLAENDYSARSSTYCTLEYYKQQTGEVLTLEEVEEYLSQEFEDDGSVRIYSNGKHPEIKKYVQWMYQYSDSEKYSPQYPMTNLGDADQYSYELIGTLRDYNKEYNTDYDFDYLTQISLNGLIKKYADPNYDIQELQEFTPTLPQKKH